MRAEPNFSIHLGSECRLISQLATFLDLGVKKNGSNTTIMSWFVLQRLGSIFSIRKVDPIKQSDKSGIRGQTEVRTCDF